MVANLPATTKSVEILKPKKSRSVAFPRAAAGAGVPSLTAGVVNINGTTPLVPNKAKKTTNQVFKTLKKVTSGEHWFVNCTFENGVQIEGTANVILEKCRGKAVKGNAVRIAGTGFVQVYGGEYYGSQNGIRVEPISKKSVAQVNVRIGGGVYLHDFHSNYGDGAQGNGISCWMARGIQIDGARIEKFIYSSVRFADTYDVVCRNVRAVGGKNDASAYAEFGWYNITFEDCEFECTGNTNGGLALTNSDPRYQNGHMGVVRRCKFIGWKGAFALKVERYVTVEDCYIEGPSIFGIIAGFDIYCARLVIQRNIIKGPNAGIGTSLRPGKEVMTTVKGKTVVATGPAVIIGNTITDKQKRIVGCKGGAVFTVGHIALLPKTTTHTMKDNVFK